MRSQQKHSGPLSQSNLSHSERGEASHLKTLGQSYCSHWELSANRKQESGA